MKKKIKIYKPFINAGMLETTTYRADWFFGILGNVLGCFIAYYIWKAVFLSNPDASMGGFTMPQMLVYVFLSFLTSTLVKSDGTYNIGNEIRDGSIAMRLIKPISYNATFLFNEIGNKLMTICILIVPMVVGIEIVRFVMTASIQFNILNFLTYILSCVFAYLINFFFNICFGFIGFFLKFLWGANMLKNSIVGVLSGAAIPLALLPDAIEQIFLILPFASLIYTPVMIYMGVYTGLDLLYYLGLQLFWVLFFWLLSKVILMVSFKYLSVQGG